MSAALTPRPARRVPRWADVEPFLHLRRPAADAVSRRLARAVSVGDVERMARRRVPGAVWDYVHSGSDAEIAMARNREAFERVELRPTVFGAVATPTSRRRCSVGPRPPLRPRADRVHPAQPPHGSARSPRRPPTRGALHAVDLRDDLDPRPGGRGAGGRNWYQLYLMRDRG
nr:alpha-hydroxy-acid oxidizing protein [Janibacter melonis]